MKYQEKIVINLPREEVVDKYSDPDNMKHWQRGFISMKRINGELGNDGSQNLLKYKMGNREIEMTETILYNNLPDEYKATYDAKGVYNLQDNRFLQNAQGNTEWISDNEFQFTGFMKVFGWFMPGAFKKQSRKYMEDFKAFAEEGKSVLDS